jgi:hypothetical protein
MKVSPIIKDYFPITDYSYLEEAGRQLENNPSHYTFPLTRSAGKLEIIPKHILSWFRSIVKDACFRADNAKTQKYKENSYDWIRRKLLHTDYTMVVSLVLAREIKVTTEEQALLLALLHDLGRFSEVTNGPLKIHAHHGIVSRDMIRDAISQKKIDGDLDQVFDIDQMLEAIAQHGLASCNEKNKLATFIRDVDKLAIVSEVKGQLKIAQYTYNKQKFWLISKNIRDQFIQDHFVDNENMQSGADSFMKCMSFFFQFVYHNSYQYAKQKGIIQYMVNMYDKYVVNKDPELTRSVHESLQL